jgi:hypothetical protein
MPGRTYDFTTSMVRSYKSCRRKFELEYIELLKPSITPDALATGSNYHTKIEQLLRHGQFGRTGERTDIMADAFTRYILPQLPPVVEVEREFRFRLAPGIYLKGKIDAIAADGTPIEHKTTAVTPDENYIYKLNWDEQVAAYMLATESSSLIYTVCQKPTIRPKQTESEDDYLSRCTAWYEETKAVTFMVSRTAAELKNKREELILLAREMRKQKLFYCNPSNCQIMGCSYSPICLDYNPEFIMGFDKKNTRNEELSE